MLSVFRTSVLVVVAAAAPALPTSAQPYPGKPIHMIVPVPAGALTDVIARRIVADVASRLGQPWIAENHPGANFMPAAEACRHARPDGYTVCVFTTSTLTFNPFLIDNLPYDPDRDFRPIINMGMLTGGIVASPKLAVANIEELHKLALAKSGELNFGTYGPASSANVFRQYLNDQWKTNIVEVGYKGSNELIAALIAGEIHMTWTALGNWADNPNESKGKIMVLDATKRSPIIPNVPTYAEVGFGDYPIHTWMGLFAPARTPDAVITQLNQVLGEVIATQKVTDFLVNQLIEPMVQTQPEFAAYVAREREATGKMFQRFNIPKIQ